MSSREPERTAQLSVLDRLLARSDAPLSLSESVADLKEAVRRDLDWLLNTRRIAIPAPDEYPEVQHSLYHFGLPDISSVSSDSETARRRLVRQVEECLQIFEPRLTNIRVTATDPKDKKNKRQVRFMIEAMLRMEPNPERVVFDTVLETSSGKIQVESDHA